MDNEQTGAGVAELPAENNPTPDTGRRAPHATERKASDASSDGEPQQQGPPRGVLREYFESLVVTAVMALFGMTFVVQAVKVPTGSMQNTIYIGDHLLVNKFIFAPGAETAPLFLPQRDIRRGDIIVFKYPGKFKSPQFASNLEVDDTRPDNLPFKTNYVKRVIGLPGDTIEEQGGHILINGEVLNERRVAAVDPGYEQPEDDPGHKAPLELNRNPPPTGEGSYSVYYRPENMKDPRATFRGKKFVVPAGHYFVMGDNRENSLDSRYWGYVPRSLVIGRALFVYWSYDESAPSNGNFLFDFFNNTRWSRTGTLVR